MYMPALPEVEEEVTGKMPLAPDCTATRLTGARQSGCEGVAVGVGLAVSEDVGVGLEVSDAVGVGLAVSVAVGVGLDVCDEDGVAVPVRDCELLGVLLRVAELLGVSVRVAELLDVLVALTVAEGLRVPEGEPVDERVGVAV